MADDTQEKHRQHRIWLSRIIVFGPAILLTIAAFVFAYRFVQPAPPREIVMATGAEDGVYYYYGRAYRDLMAQEGIAVTLLKTAGSAENIDLLNRGKADVAFVQGGTRSDDGQTTLRSLASLYFEPIWIFVREDVAVMHLADLRGKRVAIDGDGSGTRKTALLLLSDIGLDASNVKLSSLGGTEAAAALRQGLLDAAFFVIGANAPLVKSLISVPNIRLFAIDRAGAYRQQHRFLSILTLPEGAMDLVADLPLADTVLLAPAANFVVREDFHPALAELLLIEARKIHGYPGIFEEMGEFPSLKYLEYPIAGASQRFFDFGPSLLQRYLPFWAANLLDRLKIMLVPLIALAYPLFRLILPTYDSLMRSRIERWYKNLQAIQSSVEGGASYEKMRSELEELKALEHKVRRLTMPVAYGNSLYSLQQHIAMLREEICDGLVQSSNGPAVSAPSTLNLGTENLGTEQKANDAPREVSL
jgi:TRAP transporter TAXI family solute receptor